MEIGLFSFFYLAGMMVGVLGGAVRVWTWVSGGSSKETIKTISDILRSIASTLFSRKIYSIIKGLLVGVFTEAKLRSKERFRGIFKAVFIISYLSLIVAYHIKVEYMSQLEGLPSYILFFIAPFADFYFLSGISTASFTITDAFYGFINDLFGMIVILYDLFIVYERIVAKVPRKSTAEDFFCDLIVILWFIFRFAAETSTIIAFNVTPSIAQYWFIGYSFSILFKPLNLPWLALHNILWPLSGLFLGILIASIPFTKLWHIIIGPIQVLRSYIAENATGINFGTKISTPFNLRELLKAESPEIKVIGVKNVRDLNWRQRIGVEACIKCERCQNSCPVYVAGLSPMEVVQTLRKSLKEIFISDVSSWMKTLLRPLSEKGMFKSHSLNSLEEETPIVGGKLKSETIWFCLTCGACVEACPLYISPLQYLIEFRRYQTMNIETMDSSKHPVSTLYNLRLRDNPYGLPRSERVGWMRGLGVRVLGEGEWVDVLFWVGCACSYDARARKIARAVVRVLEASGVDFAVLGDEGCCGDLARRLGDEYLFQEVALRNVEKLGKYRFNMLLTACPHCYNAFKNDYPDFGLKIKVVSHVEFISRLLEANRLKLNGGTAKTITYHDPCYLHLYNNITTPPRKILHTIKKYKLKEMKNISCYGGGGGGSWIELPTQQRPNLKRLEEAEAVNPDTIATACPYCTSMLEDAVKAKNVEEKIMIKDLAEIVAELVD